MVTEDHIYNDFFASKKHYVVASPCLLPYRYPNHFLSAAWLVLLAPPLLFACWLRAFIAPHKKKRRGLGPQPMGGGAAPFDWQNGAQPQPGLPDIPLTVSVLAATLLADRQCRLYLSGQPAREAQNSPLLCYSMKATELAP